MAAGRLVDARRPAIVRIRDVAAQRYDGGNQLALRDVSDGAETPAWSTRPIRLRSAGMTVSYGGRYAQYDYLEHRTLISPRVALTVSPTDRFRVTTVVSRQTHGARGRGIPCRPPIRGSGCHHSARSRRSNGARCWMRRARCTSRWPWADIAMSTLSVGAFRQRVDDQLVTLFGVDVPAQPGAKLGHT